MIVYEINHIWPGMITSNELIFTRKLQLKKFQKLKPEKKSGFRTGLEPVPPRYRLGATTNWATKHMLGAREILVGSLFSVKESASKFLALKQ